MHVAVLFYSANWTFYTCQVVIAHYHAVHGKFKGSGYKMIDVEGQKFRGAQHMWNASREVSPVILTLYDIVLLGTSPDEVKEWREQRRKKFPTKEHVEQKVRAFACFGFANDVMCVSSLIDIVVEN